MHNTRGYVLWFLPTPTEMNITFAEKKIVVCK